MFAAICGNNAYMKPRNSPQPPRIYQLKITLQHCKPAIWRRVLVKGESTLDNLQSIIKTSMGWAGGHLHDFCFNGVYYGAPESVDDLGFEDETKVTLQDLLPEKKSSFSYTYDFGDNWLHKIVVEDIMDADPERSYPVCIKGSGACPPDDCGGVPGYYQMLEALADPKHPEHRSMRNWVGYEFDPAEFSVNWVNKQLQENAARPVPKSKRAVRKRL
jgi:hypothetical protein